MSLRTVSPHPRNSADFHHLLMPLGGIRMSCPGGRGVYPLARVGLGSPIPSEPGRRLERLSGDAKRRNATSDKRD